MGVMISDPVTATALRQELWRDRLGLAGDEGNGKEAGSDAGLVSGCRRWIETGWHNAEVLRLWQQEIDLNPFVGGGGGGGQQNQEDEENDGSRGVVRWESGLIGKVHCDYIYIFG